MLPYYTWIYDNRTNTLTCPCCWKYFSFSHKERYHEAYYFRYCPYCGEKIGFEKPYYNKYKEKHYETTNL